MKKEPFLKGKHEPSISIRSDKKTGDFICFISLNLELFNIQLQL